MADAPVSLRPPASTDLKKKRRRKAAARPLAASTDDADEQPASSTELDLIGGHGGEISLAEARLVARQAAAERELAAVQAERAAIMAARAVPAAAGPTATAAAAGPTAAGAAHAAVAGTNAAGASNAAVAGTNAPGTTTSAGAGTNAAGAAHAAVAGTNAAGTANAAFAGTNAPGTNAAGTANAAVAGTDAPGTNAARAAALAGTTAAADEAGPARTSLTTAATTTATMPTTAHAGREGHRDGAPDLTPAGTPPAVGMPATTTTAAAPAAMHATAKHFGVLKHFVDLDYHPDEHLIRRPVVRQYFRTQQQPDGTTRDVLYRESEHRTATWNELFFDLVMVAVLHTVGDTLVQDFNGPALQRFLLTFMPIWNVWVDMTAFLNVHDNGDLLIKAYVFIQMALVVGMGASATYALETTTTQFIGAFLLSRLLMLLMSAYNGLHLEGFFMPVMLFPAILGFCSIPYLALLGLEGSALIQAFWAANVLGLALIYVLMLALMPPMRRWYSLRTAINIEHYSERFGLLTIITLGESIISVMFVNQTAAMEVTYAAAMLGLLGTYSLQWIYFDVDASRNFQHAIRRYVITGFLFWAVHLPLQMAVVSAGAALGYIIEVTQAYADAPASGGPAVLESILPSSIRWLYCVSIATALWCMSFLGMLHKSLDQVNVTPLDTLGRKVVNFVSGYGFVATRRATAASPPAGDQPPAVHPLAQRAGDPGASSSASSASLLAAPVAPGAGASSDRARPRGSTPPLDGLRRLRARMASPKTNRLAVTNMRKTARIAARVVVGLAISLLPLAGTGLSPTGLVGTTAGLLAFLVLLELWGGLQRNTLRSTAHFSPASGLALILVAAVPIAPGAMLSLHGAHHDHPSHPHPPSSKKAGGHEAASAGRPSLNGHDAPAGHPLSREDTGLDPHAGDHDHPPRTTPGLDAPVSHPRSSQDMGLDPQAGDHDHPPRTTPGLDAPAHAPTGELGAAKTGANVPDEPISM